MSTISRTHSFEIDLSMSDVFSLFTPEGEKEWVPGWDYENVMGNTQLSEDDVFVTGSHDFAVDRAVWIVKRHDPTAHLVQYYRVEPNEKVGTVTVECDESGEGRTRVTVTYKWTALTEAGEEFVASYDEDIHAEFIEEWRELLLAYIGGS